MEDIEKISYGYIARFILRKNEEERVMYENLAQNWKLMIEKLQREERELKARRNAKPRRKYLFGWI